MESGLIEKNFNRDLFFYSVTITLIFFFDNKSISFHNNILLISTVTKQDTLSTYLYK